MRSVGSLLTATVHIDVYSEPEANKVEAEIKMAINRDRGQGKFEINIESEVKTEIEDFMLRPMLTRSTHHGLRTVHTGYAYQPPACR